MSAQISGELTLTLPEGWWLIGLEDDEERIGAVEAVVADTFPREGPGARFRTTFVRDLLDMTAKAAHGGALALAMSVAGPGSGTVPASLTIVRIPGASVRKDGGVRLAARLLAGNPPGVSVDRAECRFGPVVRRVRTSAETMSPAPDGPTPESLVVDYWLEPEPGKGLLSLVFASPLPDMRESLLDLFDAIVASVGVLPDARETSGPEINDGRVDAPSSAVARS